MRWLLVASVAVAGCGDSTPYPLAGPSSVVPPLRANVSGRYTGTIAFRDDRGPNEIAITLRLVQTGLAFDGTWASFADGTITGTVSGTLASADVPTSVTTRWTMDAPGSEGRCVGSVQADGTAFPLVLSAPTWSLSGCVPLQDVRWKFDQAWGTP